MGKARGANYATGVVSVSTETLAAFDPESLADIRVVGPVIQKVLASDGYQPPLLPEVAVSLTKLANKPNVAISEVVRTVNRDPLVAGRVISMANSAFYSRGTPVRDLKLAVTRLGLAAIRDIAFQIVAKTKIFRVPSYSEHMKKLFDTALAAGIVTREICKTLRFEQEMAYLCGLLHDMGEAIILGILGEAWAKKGATPVPVEGLANILDSLHAIAGARVCSHWKLPPMLIDAVRHHHELEKADTVSQMATVVAVGDILLAHAGIGTDKKPADPLSEPLFYKLNLTPTQVEQLLEFAESLGEDPDTLDESG